MWLINLSALALGLFCAPRSVFAAYARGRRSESIYQHPATVARLVTTTVGDVRGHLGLKSAVGAPRMSDYFSFTLWAILGMALLVIPAIAILTALWLLACAFRH